MNHLTLNQFSQACHYIEAASQTSVALRSAGQVEGQIKFLPVCKQRELKLCKSATKLFAVEYIPNSNLSPLR